MNLFWPFTILFRPSKKPSLFKNPPKEEEEKLFIHEEKEVAVKEKVAIEEDLEEGNFMSKLWYKRYFTLC